MYTLFYYWDDIDGNEMPYHIKLCMETWNQNSMAERIIRVNKENIEVISYGAITSSQMKLFTPAQRSDAAMAATMSIHQGLFLDADTILLPTFNPARYLKQEVPTMYAAIGAASPLPMLSFLACPRKGSSFMKAWLDGTQRQIHHEETSSRRILRRAYRERIQRKHVHVRWDYLGAAIINDLAAREASQASLMLLDTVETGYLPRSGSANYGPQIVNDYWLAAGSDSLFSSTDYTHGIVTLQNSWLPQNIRTATEAELLEHPSRLGRLFRYALDKIASVKLV